MIGYIFRVILPVQKDQIVFILVRGQFLIRHFLLPQEQCLSNGTFDDSTNLKNHFFKISDFCVCLVNLSLGVF